MEFKLIEPEEVISEDVYQITEIRYMIGCPYIDRTCLNVVGLGFKIMQYMQTV
jgi:hypothetical protein